MFTHLKEPMNNVTLCQDHSRTTLPQVSHKLTVTASRSIAIVIVSVTVAVVVVVAVVMYGVCTATVVVVIIIVVRSCNVTNTTGVYIHASIYLHSALAFFVGLL